MPRLPLLLLFPVLAACAATAPAPDGAPPGPTTAAAPAGMPSGTYATTIAESDVPASMSAEERSGLAGAWEIVMDGSGRAAVRYNGRQMVEAPYTVNGQEITFGADDTGEYACHMPARYTWQASGGQLRFTRVEDGCGGRVVVLTTRPLTRRP